MSMDRLSTAASGVSGQAPLTPFVSYLVVCAGILTIVAVLMVLMSSGKRPTTKRKLTAVGLFALGILLVFGGLIAGSTDSIFAQDPAVAAFVAEL